MNVARTISKSHQDKRSALLDIATQVFAKQGFDRASMNLVAKEAGVSKAVLYHYFPGKDAILYAILERHLLGLRDHIINLENNFETDREFFVYMVEEILLFYRGNDDVHVLQLHALGQLEEQDQKVLVGYMRTLISHVSEVIVRLCPHYENNQNQLRMATMSLFGMVNWYYTWNRGRGVEGRREYARYAANLFLEGALK